MMKSERQEYITSGQVTASLIGSVIGTEILYLPRYMVSFTEQDAWIYTAFGAIYPLYITLIGSFFCSMFPEYNILFLSKKFLGKIPGSILNALFLLQFFFYITIRCSQFSNLINVYIVYFLTPRIIILITVLTSAYCSSKGVQFLGRLNEILFYIALPIILAPVGALPSGNIKNIMPVMQTNFEGAVSGILHGTYNFYGVEIILLIYPYVNNTRQFKKSAIFGLLIFTSIMVWTVFISIYYLGIDLLPKYLWPALPTVKALNLRAIRNFTFIFMFFWVIVVLRNIANNYISIVLVLKSFFQKSNMTSLSIYIMPLIYYASTLYGNEVMSRMLLFSIMPFLIVFNIFYTCIISLMILVRKKVEL